MKQFMLTPSMGKRLIARAMLRHPHVQAAMAKGRLLIIAGTTNGYIAEEILRASGQMGSFRREGFYRGLVVPPGVSQPPPQFLGDVLLTDGVYQPGRTAFDVAGQLGAGDVILKGANALDLHRKRAAVYVAHTECGTAGAVLPAVVGRRARLIVPVGLEKRVEGDLSELAALANSPDCEGPRLLVLPGEVFTELEAMALLSGCRCCLAAAGGVRGAEGCVFLLAQGNEAQLQSAQQVVESLAHEPPCQV